MSDFLRNAGWGGARRSILAGDASRRSYERLLQDGETAVLMIAPPESGEDTAPFLRVSRYLSDLGLSAPGIIAADPSSGLLLIEDLGDDLFARVAAASPTMEPKIYQAAVDVLVHLHARPPPSWAAPYDTQTLTDLVSIAFEWYAGQAAHDDVASELRSVFADTEGLSDVLVLRDFHAENLLWLPGRTGLARTGLLDFQDAVAGHRAYDLVSLVEDARRDLQPGLAEDLVGYYLSQTIVDEDAFRRAFCALGAQRNLRILGVFARLAIRDGKPGYISMIPRVWAHLQRDLAHPALARLRDLIRSELPKPDAAQIERLRERCSQTQ